MIDPTGPTRKCTKCGRLAEFRRQNRKAFPDWENAPVTSFGPTSAVLLIVGLAPGLRGANRTGRPFTGDFAGDLLYPTLRKFGFGAGDYDSRPDDDFVLNDCRITNAVRCVPPQNKPTTEEIRTCNQYLRAEIDAMPALRVVLSLGLVAHKAVLRAFDLVAARYPFAHGAMHQLPTGMVLANSYHCSRYNTNTGRLTEAMFHRIFAEVHNRLTSVQRDPDE